MNDEIWVPVPGFDEGLWFSSDEQLYRHRLPSEDGRTREGFREKSVCCSNAYEFCFKGKCHKLSVKKLHKLCDELIEEERRFLNDDKK